MSKVYDLTARVPEYRVARLPSKIPTYIIEIENEDGSSANLVVQLSGVDPLLAEEYARVIESHAPLSITFVFEDVLGVGNAYEYHN